MWVLGTLALSVSVCEVCARARLGVCAQKSQNSTDELTYLSREGMGAEQR